MIGVTDAFKRSDTEKPINNLFRLEELTDTAQYSEVDYLARIKPGHINDFLNIAGREVFNVLDSRYWSIATLNTLENQRVEQNSNSRVKRLITLLIIIFVIINILLGVIGILWYNTNLRVHEIGIKRAIGSYGKRIAKHIILENLLLAITASVPVFILLAQAEGLRVAHIKGEMFILSQAIAFTLLIILVILCSWIPARIASSVRPADALKYE